MTKIAIIGAGIAGLSAAIKLGEQTDVTLFEKSWRAGGRLTTREKDFCFDHGAQYFVVKTKAFAAFLAPFVAQGHIRQWDARFVEIDYDRIVSSRKWNDDYPHYVAAPGMVNFARQLASGLDIHYQTRVTAIISRNQRWELFSDNALLGCFDWVIMAIPAPQAAELMPDCFSHLAHIQNITMQACFSLMLGFTQPLALEFDAALVKNADISWISVNSTKPGRAKNFTLLAHSTNDWADNHLDMQEDAAIKHLVAALSKVLHSDLSAAAFVDVHRWLYANVDRQSGPSSLVDRDNKLAAIGDWCITGRLEAAFTSGNELDLELSA